MLNIKHYDSPLGKMLLAESDGLLVGVWFEGQKYFPSDCIKSANEDKNNSVLCRAEGWLDCYFSGGAPSPTELDFEISPRGSEFQKQVWNILLQIPYGEVMTYGEIAKRIAEQQGIEKMSAQAVGGAVGHNPISIIIPCHRVIGSNGLLIGYAGGLDKKRALLEIEGI